MNFLIELVGITILYREMSMTHPSWIWLSVIAGRDLDYIMFNNIGAELLCNKI